MDAFLAEKQLCNSCKIFSTATQEENQEEWLKARTHGIGGSDIGTVCGVNPYSSPRMLYLQKTGQFDNDIMPSSYSSDASKERMLFGHILEPVVASEFERRSGKRIVNVKATFQHNEYPWALANVDRFIVDENNVIIGVLECKTAGEYLNSDWDTGDIPISYIYQLNWYLWITGLKYGCFACLVGGNKFHMIEVYRNEDLVAEMIQKADTFWNHNVKQLIPPDFIGNEADKDLVNAENSEVVKNSEIVVSDEEYDNTAVRIYQIKKQLKDLEAELLECSNKIKDKIGCNEICYTPRTVIKWPGRSMTTVDSKRLKLEAPQIFGAYSRVTKYRALSVKLIGGEDE